MIRKCSLGILLYQSCQNVHVPEKAHTGKVGQQNKKWWREFNDRNSSPTLMVIYLRIQNLAKQHRGATCPPFSTPRDFIIVLRRERRQLTITDKALEL